MPVLKTEEIRIKNNAVDQRIKLKIMVSAAGEFYCHLEPDMIEAAKGVFCEVGSVQMKNNILKVSDKTLDALIAKTKQAYANYFEPEVIKEPVIRYNLESHVSFAEDADGNIFPNSGYAGAKWRLESEIDRKKYGGHHAQTPSNGGYSLTIGAVAYMKTTYRYGDSEKVRYERYYGIDGDHHGRTNPAEKLNSWTSFDLGDRAKEIPYSDDAAEFFYNLMLGMAKLSQLIQERTFDQFDLLQLIASNQNLLIGSKPSNY